MKWKIKIGGKKERKQLWKLSCYFRSIADSEALVAGLDNKTEMLL